VSEKTESKAAEAKYSKAQLAKSGKWSADAVNAVLEDKEYTMTEADKAINGFLKRSVK
jgi:hypothetical protein